MTGPSNSRFSLTGDPNSESVARLLEGVVTLVEAGRLPVREAERLVGHVLMDWALEHAKGPLVTVLGKDVPVRPSGARPASTSYRLEKRLRELGLPVEVGE